MNEYVNEPTEMISESTRKCLNPARGEKENKLHIERMRKCKIYEKQLKQLNFCNIKWHIDAYYAGLLMQDICVEQRIIERANDLKSASTCTGK